MFKSFMFCIILVLLSGCTGKQLKDTGSAFGKSNAVGVLIGAPIYGIGYLVEKNEKEEFDKLAKEKAKVEQSNVEKPLEVAKIIEEEKIPEEITKEEVKK